MMEEQFRPQTAVEAALYSLHLETQEAMKDPATKERIDALVTKWTNSRLAYKDRKKVQ